MVGGVTFNLTGYKIIAFVYILSEIVAPSCLTRNINFKVVTSHSKGEKFLVCTNKYFIFGYVLYLAWCFYVCSSFYQVLSANTTKIQKYNAEVSILTNLCSSSNFSVINSTFLRCLVNERKVYFYARRLNRTCSFSMDSRHFISCSLIVKLRGLSALVAQDFQTNQLSTSRSRGTTT